MSSSGSGDIQITQRHLDLISQIYDLPLHPERWSTVLDQFASIMGANMIGIAVHDPMTSGQQLSVSSSNFTPALQAEYNTQISTLGESPYAKMAANPKREFWTELEMLGMDNIEQYLARPSSQWLIQKFNVTYGIGSCLNLDRSWTDILSILFPENQGHLIPHKKQLGSIFLDHFAKAMEINRSFSLLKSRFDGVLTALDRFHIGIFILSPNGTVILKNTEAERLIAEDDGVSLSREGYIHPNTSDKRPELKAAIKQAATTAEAQNNHAETLLTLPRKSGKDPYLVEVSPFRGDDDIESLFSGCLVFIIDPAKTDTVTTKGMQKIYGMTPSEAEVCRLVAEGYVTDDIADARNITRETVRNYVKQILHKTGTSNRSQLVRLALSVNLPIDVAPSKTDTPLIK